MNTGCVNGGGQIRGETKELRSSTTEIINNIYSEYFVEKAEDELQKIELEWEKLNENYKEHLFVDYKPIKILNNSTNLVQSW